MGVVVETGSGRVEGVSVDGVQSFKGIPYAQPPVGALRFAAPQPPQPWTGVRDCSDFGFTAPQPPSLMPGMAPGVQNEDCLYLNVYTPNADAERRPVMVWIHGGAFTGGSGSQDLYAGGPIVRRGQVVLVTINYRLGALGYLHLGEHADQLDGAVSNCGQRDQIAALEWVRDNIANFGGDPGNVTIFGESAGAMAVSTLLAMPAAKGLFQRGIAQSGAAHATQSVAMAAAMVDAFTTELGIAKSDLAKLRDVPTDKLIEAQVKAMLRTASGTLLPYAPAIDGATLPRSPLDVVRDGGAADIALMVGSNGDEWKLFSSANPKHEAMDEATLEKLVSSRVAMSGGDDPNALLAVYRETRPATAPCDLFDAFEGDRIFRIPAVRLAEAQRAHQAKTWQYSFTFPSPARRGKLGACHALELPFVFGTLDAPTMDKFAGSGPDVEALSASMMDRWLAFAHTGDPNSEGLSDWAPYCEEHRHTLIFDREIEQRSAPEEAERLAWEGLIVDWPLE